MSDLLLVCKRTCCGAVSSVTSGSFCDLCTNVKVTTLSTFGSMNFFFAWRAF